MTGITLARVLTVTVVLCGVTPFAGLLLFMRWQALKGREKAKRRPKWD
jgi:hypothetical protein